MKYRKTLFSLGFLLGAGLATYAGLKWNQERVEGLEREEAMAAIRQHFEEMGPVATVYALLHESDADTLYGGVVMEDDRRFVFELHQGDLHYEEEV